MMKAKLITVFGSATLAIAAACSTTAWAGSATLTLTSVTLVNVVDAAGTLQHEAGAVQNTTGIEVGRYLLKRRVTTGGAEAFNAAAETITLFFPPATGSDAPQTMTLQGAHTFNSGTFLGSVSASSLKHHALIGADASMTFSTGTLKLVITWVGGDAIHFP